MKRMFLRLSLLSVLFLSSAFASGPWISLSSGMAGQDVPVRVSGLLESENLSMLLVRPDDSKISLNAAADDLGVASFFVHGLHVRHAGEYELLIRRGQSSYITTEQFSVAPNSVSAYRSTQSVDIPSLAADGEQVARIRVQAKDAHGNLITNAPVRAFSSRTEDAVIVAPQTNENGEVVIKVSSSTPGISAISVLVGDVILFERTELVFHLANTGAAAMGASGIGKFLQAQLFDDPTEGTPVAYFSIEDIGAEVTAGKNLTVRVGAKDENGDVVTDYTGVIRFSSSDDRAVLPNDYTFATEDQGWHTFYLSVMLQTPGMQTVAVHDLEDFRISGERTVTVADGSGVIAIPDPDSKLTIDVPVNGATFSTSRITVSGTAVGCSLVRLADGPIELIGELPVDASGSYVYQTPGLADGMHIFQATCVEDAEIVSNTVQIIIDRSPPQVMSTEFVPAENVEPGSFVTLNVGASDELSAVSAVFLGQRYELEAVDSKNFTGTLRAPATPGEYPVEITLADLLGNEMTESNAGVLVVGLQEELDNDDEGAGEGDENENIAPLPISNLQTAPGEKLVTLLWSPAIDDDGIKNYRVNYGVCGEELIGVNITPDARTQWYVDGLDPCIERCFQVTPIDTKEMEGVSSEIVPGTPFCEEEEHPAPPKTGGTTPLLFAVFSIMAGFGAVLFLRRTS